MEDLPGFNSQRQRTALRLRLPKILRAAPRRRKLYELQQERLTDLNTGDISQKDYDKFQEKINNKLAHLHLVS